MKTFTVRDLDRAPSAVLDECDRQGAAKIRRRDGRTYTLQPDGTLPRISKIPDIRSRLAKTFPRIISPVQTRLADKLIAGE